MDQDAEINFSEDLDGDKYFCFTGFDDREVRDLTRKVEKLGGFVVTDATWNSYATHVISRTFEKSEIVLAGLAAGRWVLKEDFVHDSFSAKVWARGRVYVHDECVISHRKNRRRLGKAGLAFYNMKAMFVMDDLETKEVYQRIVDAGGGQWLGVDLQKARQRRFHGDHLTHIIIDPWVLEQKDWRYRDYQDWQRYERSVSMNSSDDGEGPGWRNGGTLFKLHYTFLMDKLLHPLERIIENKYTIFNEKVQDMAKKRKRRREEMKMKQEKKHKKESVKKYDSSSDEDDLLVIKERYKEKERRKQPGRFYMEKSRPVVKESLCEKEARQQEQVRLGGARGRKREKSPDELVANLGYMDSSRKKNKRSGGSQIKADPGRHYKVGPDGKSVFVDTDLLIGDHGFGPLESRQSFYINNLSQSIRDIEMSHSNQFGPGKRSFKEERGMKSEMDSKFGIKQENRFNFQNRRTFKKEVVVDLESDSDIEEITEESKPRVKKEYKPKMKSYDLVHIDVDDDDDIAIIDDTQDFLPPGIVIIPDKSWIKPEIHDDIVALDEIDTDVKDVKLMEVDRDWKIDSDDEIEIIEYDRKPNLDELVRSLGPLPEITIESSDDDEDLECEDQSEDDDMVIVPPSNLENTFDISEDSFVLEDGASAMMKDGVILLRRDLDSPGYLEQEPLVDTTAMDDASTTSTVEHFLSSNEPTSLLGQGTGDSVTVPPPPPPKSTKTLASTLFHQLNQTLLARQDMTAEHISISLVCARTPQYNKHTIQERQASLVPVNQRVLMEFTREGDEVNLKRRKSRRKTKKTVVDLFEEDAGESDSELVKMLKILEDSTCSKNHPYPAILNCIFTKFFPGKSSYVIDKAQNYLSKFHFLHFGEKGAHREQLMLITLNSLREVSDRELFKKFEKDNPVDIRSVWTFFKSLLEKSEKCEETVNGCEELLKVLVRVFQTDLEVWWKHHRSASMPLIYYVFGGSDFISNCEEVIPKMFLRCLSPDIATDPWYIRRLVAMTAMVAAHLDDKNNEGFLNQGSKVSLARAVARQCHSVESNILYTELYLMQPNWFSYLVSKQVMEANIRQKKIVSLGDLTKMFQGLTVESNQEELSTCEIMMQKYFSFTYTHVFLRANWFFSNQSSDKLKFSTFSEMKKLVKLDSRKGLKDVVKFRNSIKMSVSQQMRDLKTLTKFCTGTDSLRPEREILLALLFKMDREEDNGWHPGLDEIE